MSQPANTERERVLRWLDALYREQWARGRTAQAAEAEGFMRCAVAVFLQPALLMTTIYAIAEAAWRLTVFCQED